MNNLSNILEFSNGVLHLIAKRLNPDFKFLTDSHWIEESLPDRTGMKRNKCLICDYIIYHEYKNGSSFPDSTVAVAQHALVHLKEYKLLAFL